MPDDTPHEDGAEATPGSGRPATGHQDRTVPAPAPPADDDDAPPPSSSPDDDPIETTDPSGATGTTGRAEPSETGEPTGAAEHAEPSETGELAGAADRAEASGTGGRAEASDDAEPGASREPEDLEPGDPAPGAGKAGDAGEADGGGEGVEDDDSGKTGDSGGSLTRGSADGGERGSSAGGAVGIPARTTVESPAPDPALDVEQRKREAGVDHLFPFGRPGQPLGRAHPFVFGFTAALGVITAWMLVKAATNAKSVLVMIAVAMFLAVGLNPAVERLRRFGLPRGAAVASVFLVVILFFAGFVASLVQPVSEQVTELRKNIPDYVTQLQDNKRLADWDKRYGLLERAEKTVNSNDFQNKLTDIATGIGKVAVNGIFQTITILILTLYFMSSLPQIKMFFYKLAPRSRRARVALLGDEILDRIGGYVAGQFTIAFIAGLSSYIFLEILGVKYALALALIVAVTDLVPLIGATIGAVIVSLVAFLTGNLTHLIACAIFYLIYQQLENYVVYPRVMTKTVDVQPAVTIVAALIGGALLGVVGALIAIPTAAAISLLIREVVVPRQETL